MKYKVVKLGEICDFVYGDSLKEADREGGIFPVYGSNGIIGWHNKALTNGETIIIGRKGSIGEVHLSKEPCWAIDTTFFIDKTKVRCDFTWLYYILSALELSKLNKAAAVPGLNREDAYEQIIPLPSLPEQQRIAAVLEKADRLRQLCHYARRLSDLYLQSVFLDIFYKHENKDWPKYYVADLAKPGKNTIRTGPFGSQLLHTEFVDKGIVVLGIDNAVQNRFVWGKLRFITIEKYQQLKRYTVFPGDVVVTIMGTNGRCAIIPNSIPLAINTKHLCCITLDPQKCLPEFFHQSFLHHPNILSQLGISQRGAVMPGLNMEIIKGIIISLPPIQHQQVFAKIVGKYDSIYAKYAESEYQAEHLFQSLLQRTFQGGL